jgi:diguanylate cyclase (GGDEF)-like protein/PAS domain S-box-containing protein
MLDLKNPDVFRAVLKSLKMGVCVVDPECKIAFWNDRAEEITGYLRQDVLGRTCREDLLIPYDESNLGPSEQVSPFLTAMRDGNAHEVRVFLHHKAGYPVPVTVWVVPLRNSQGEVMGAAGSFVEKPCVPMWHCPESGLAPGAGLDAVTQLPDHRFTELYLGDRLKYATEHAIPFGVLCIGLDQLDSFTSAHGRDAAEAILNVIAHALRNGLDPLDFVGRWSEDQFLALVSNCGDSALVATGEHIKRLVRYSAVTWWGDALSVTVSVGATAMRPDETLESLVERVGEAFQESVSGGGNRVSVCGAQEQP